MGKLLVVGIGGTTRPGSSTEKALRCVGQYVSRMGANWELFSGSQLLLPLYRPNAARSHDGASNTLVAAMRASDAVVIASPGYHGMFSGLVKNALEYAEELADDERPYLSGRAVGCIASGLGWQAIGTTLISLKSVACSLGAWTAPENVAINTSTKIFNESGEVENGEVKKSLYALAEQMVEFASMRQSFKLASAKASGIRRENRAAY
jgi:FMN reductase